MDKRTKIIAGAARIFEAEGFRGIGIDRVIEPSGVSTRTLYKHFGSRDGLVLAVLEARHRAFMERLDAQPDWGDPVGALFDALRDWIDERGARGCMLLRARSEYAGASEEIVALVQAQKADFLEAVRRRVRRVLGRDDATLSNQIWLLFEGATAAASVTSATVVDDAKSAARSLLESVRGGQR